MEGNTTSIPDITTSIPDITTSLRPYSNLCRHYRENESGDVWSNDGTRLGLDKAYIGAALISAILSAFGSILIIAFYYKIPEFKTKSRRQLVYLSICDLLIGTGNFIGAIW